MMVKYNSPQTIIWLKKILDKSLNTEGRNKLAPTR